MRLARKVSEVSEASEVDLGPELLLCLKANNCCDGVRNLDASCTVAIGSGLGLRSAFGARAAVLRCWTPR